MQAFHHRANLVVGEAGEPRESSGPENGPWPGAGVGAQPGPSLAINMNRGKTEAPIEFCGVGAT
eukprot:4645652-Lingulodinium_polyedra.AAC.1